MQKLISQSVLAKSWYPILFPTRGLHKGLTNSLIWYFSSQPFTNFFPIRLEVFSGGRLVVSTIMVQMVYCLSLLHNYHSLKSEPDSAKLKIMFGVKWRITIMRPFGASLETRLETLPIVNYFTNKSLWSLHWLWLLCNCHLVKLEPRFCTGGKHASSVVKVLMATASIARLDLRHIFINQPFYKNKSSWSCDCKRLLGVD